MTAVETGFLACDCWQDVATIGDEPSTSAVAERLKILTESTEILVFTVYR